MKRVLAFIFITSVTKNTSRPAILWLIFNLILVSGIFNSVKAGGYSASEATQISAQTSVSAINQELIRVSISATTGGGNCDVTEIQFTMQNTNDADVSKATLYYTGTSNVFATTTSKGVINNPTGNITFPVAGVTGLSNTTVYFWLAFDIAPDATVCDNFIDAFVPANGITISGTGAGTKTPTTNNPAGNRQIIGAGCWNYCTSAATFPNDEDIFNVSLNDLNNSSTCATTGDAGSILNTYSNFNVLSATVNPGSNYNFSVEVGTCGGNFSNGLKIFIDFNSNGVLNDAGEEVYVSAATTSGPHAESGVINIPAGAQIGETRMRVMVIGGTIAEVTGTTPCSAYQYGETEDYTISICGVTIPAAPTTTGASRCGVGAVTPLTASGAAAGENYKWYDTATAGTLLQTNGSTYTTPSISENTTYYASIYNTTATCAESNRTAVVASVNVSPSINSQPVGVSVCPSADVTFSVTTSGSGLMYQWQEGIGGFYNNITDGGIYSGATSANLNLTGVTPGMDGYQYKVIVSGICAPSVTSDVTALTVTAGTLPTTADAGLDQFVTNSSTTLAGNIITTGTGLWSLISGSGTITSHTSPTTDITGLAAGPSVAVFRWTSTNGSCTTYDEVTVVRTCLGTYTNNCGFAIDITNVSVSNINNSSSCFDGGTNNNTNFTNTVGSIESGINYPITVSRGGTVNGCWWGIWVDWNKDGDFLDNDEFMSPINSPSGTLSNSGTLTVPEGLATGTYLMRIRSKESTAMTQASICDNYAYGEQEDYVLKVVPASCYNAFQDQGETSVDCGGSCFTPVAGTISGGGTFACSSTAVTLNLSGAAGSIQWQFSLTNNDPWYDIENATGTSHTSTAPQTIYFRAKVSGGSCNTVYSPINASSAIVITNVTQRIASVSGNWSSTTTWGGASVPDLCNDVIVNSGITVTTDLNTQASACNNITITSGGQLDITYQANNYLTIYGNIVNNSNGNGNANGGIQQNSQGNASGIALAGVGTEWGGTNNGLYPNLTVRIEDGSNSSLTADAQIDVLDATKEEVTGTVSLGSQTLKIVHSFYNSGSSVHVNTGYLWLQITQDMAVQQSTIYPEYGTVFFDLAGNWSITGDWSTIGSLGGFYNLEMKSTAGTVSNNTNHKTRGHFKILSGSGTVKFDETTPYTLQCEGDFINEDNDGTPFLAGLSTVSMEGSAPQNITGPAVTSFYKLTVNNTGSGVMLNGVDAIVPETLSCDEGPLYLNTQRLTVDNASILAISRTNGHVVSETDAATNPSILQWNIGSTTGNHVFPFGTTDGHYIPVTFNNKGNNSGNTSISTRRTIANDNEPWATGVTNMLGLETHVDNTIDRWWEITPTTAVSSNVTVSYVGFENTTTASGDGGLQHWTGAYWNDGRGGAQGTFAEAKTLLDATGTNIGVIEAFNITEFSPFIGVIKPSTLPIMLLSFDATLDKKEVILDWTTATEINNDYFTIERSKDGIYFEDLLTVNSKSGGNSNQELNYTEKDIDPYDGISFYRLKQTDFDGQYSYSKMVTVKVINASSGNVTTYPNPAKDYLSIILENEELINNNIRVSVFDITGKIIASESLQSNTINVSKLSTGIYSIEISGQNSQYRTRFIKE